jgi:hypothetical protein
VTRQHILQAIAEYDERGGDSFLGVYGFGPSPELQLVHEGRSYHSTAILGVAHRFATGRLATSDEFHDDMSAAAALLRRHGFELAGPAVAVAAAPAAPARRAAAGRTTTPRTTAPRPSTRSAARRAEERPPAICPTCFTVLPATGICDTCS